MHLICQFLVVTFSELILLFFSSSQVNYEACGGRKNTKMGKQRKCEGKFPNLREMGGKQGKKEGGNF